MTKLQEPANLGQSTWLDYIRRSFIASGELKKGTRHGASSGLGAFEFVVVQEPSILILPVDLTVISLKLFGK